MELDFEKLDGAFTNKSVGITSYIRTFEVLKQASNVTILNCEVLESMMVHFRINWLAVCLSICITVTYAQSLSRMIAGNDASIGEFPYQVSIQKDGEHHCGGSIIDATHILTAAHCLVNGKYQINKGLDVVTGTIDRLERTASNVFPVAEVFYYPSYDGYNQYNDIGILKLAKSIPFTSYRRPIQLPTNDILDSRRPAVLSGWGVTSWIKPEENNQFSRKLQKLTMKIISNEECQKRWNQQTDYYTDINATHICVLPAKKLSGMCFGDSGSPLAQNNKVVGISTLVFPCGKGFPDIYTRVSKYLPWISWALAQ